MSEVSFDFSSINLAPKDGKLLMLWSPCSGFWIGSYRYANDSEHRRSYENEKAWRDANGREGDPVLFAVMPTDVEMLRLAEVRNWLEKKEVNP